MKRLVYVYTRINGVERKKIDANYQARTTDWFTIIGLTIVGMIMAVAIWL